MASTREAMLDSAITLFRQRGVAATSMRDIVEHGQAPRGSIYHHFPGGKEELAREATQRAGDFIGSLLTGLANDPAEAIEKFIGFWRGALASADFLDGCPIASGALSDEARDVAGAAFTSWEETLAAHIESKGVPVDRAESLATLAIASVEGALIMARAQRSDEPLRRVGQELAQLI
ncbi:MAG TPA: TetR/AcrR family transcriptional regulator [Nocardioidaceae bacterium]|nr:TetR/AcrR family transcriptional regulator [Nocardioidaceae bacterium]